MKKVFATLTVLAMLTIGSAAVFAQEAAVEEAAAVENVVVTDTAAVAEEMTEEAPAEEKPVAKKKSKSPMFAIDDDAYIEELEKENAEFNERIKAQTQKRKEENQKNKQLKLQ